MTIDAQLHPELERHLVSHEIPSDTQAMINERLDNLRDALDTIDDRDKKMLLMHEGEGIPLAEIASEFKLTVPGVKTRLFRARTSIKKYVIQNKGEAA